MKVVTGLAEMKALSQEWKRAGLTVGFVPTMGFLHEGHLSLVRASRGRVDSMVVSIFVNPAQFGPGEDFQKYPRDLERDAALLEKEGVDVIFHPSAEEMYPPGFKTFVEVRDLQDRLCGASRQGHFRGVATVVLKLFDIVGPDVAFFGWKDAQQVVILKKMVRDLNLDVEIVACPLIREPDGLAMSSRNTYLSTEERRAALVLSRSLAEAEGLIEAGERDASRVVGAIREMIGKEPLAKIDYVEAVGLEDLRPLDRLSGEVLIALAVFIGSTRLIDNVRTTV
jgi:pantoate--beta-alanine ligase